MPFSHNPYLMIDEKTLNDVVVLIERVRSLLSDEMIRIQGLLKNNDTF